MNYAVMTHVSANLSPQYNLMMLALLAFEVTIHRHQQLYRLRHHKVMPPTKTLFHDITRRHLDSSVLSCVKYLLNYFFYKFGLEVTHTHSHLVMFKSIHPYPSVVFFSDLLPVGCKCHWSEDGSVRCRPCLWPHHCPITTQQEAHCLSVAKVLLLCVWAAVLPVPAVHWLPSGYM